MPHKQYEQKADDDRNNTHHADPLQARLREILFDSAERFRRRRLREIFAGDALNRGNYAHDQAGHETRAGENRLVREDKAGKASDGFALRAAAGLLGVDRRVWLRLS